MVKRHFLLKSKLKYAGIPIINSIIVLMCNVDGQKIAKKMSKQITKQTSTINNIVKKVNNARSVIDSSSGPVDISDVLKPDGSFWKSAKMYNESIPSDVKHEVIQNYLLLERSKEEITLLNCDVGNMVDYYHTQESIFTTKIIQLVKNEVPSLYNRGCISLLTCIYGKSSSTLPN